LSSAFQPPDEETIRREYNDHTILYSRLMEEVCFSLKREIQTLDYKQEIDIPSNLRRDFYALSGLFYVADTHFELFRSSVNNLKEELQESVRKDTFDINQEMNLNTLQAYLHWKLPKRKRTIENEYSILLGELQATGYDQFDKLDSAFEKMYPALIEDEKRDPPGGFVKGKASGSYNDVGVIRWGFKILDPKFAKHDLSLFHTEDAQEQLNKFKEKREKYKLV